MSRSILHCDMNNFYASVECMLDPALRKYPVAVCGSVEERHGKTVDDYSGYAQEGNMAVQARTRMDGIREKPDGERYGLSLLLTQLCATGLQRLGKPFP